MVFTGHSLGRDKLEQLLKQGRQSRDEINMTYKIMRRIEAEELSLDASEIVITSTRQEIEEQWRLYDGFDPILERKLRARIKRNVSCYGRFMPRMFVSSWKISLFAFIPLLLFHLGETIFFDLVADICLSQWNKGPKVLPLPGNYIAINLL